MSVKLRKKKLKDGRTSLYLDIYAPGHKREYEFLKMYIDKNMNKDQRKEVQDMANEVRVKRELELQASFNDVSISSKKKKNFITYFEDYTKKKNDNVHLSALKKLKEYANNKPVPFSAINTTFLEGFQEILLEKVSVNSAATYYMKLNTVLNSAVREKIINSNPANRVKKIKHQDVIRTFLTIDELKVLASTECPDPEVKRAFLFSCFTGLRYSDVKNLTWGEIKEDKIHFRQRKTSDVEYLPLSQSAMDLINGGREENTIPMPSNKIFKLRNRVYDNNIIKRWIARAGIDKPITYHSSRHSFATMSLTQGVDLYTVSKLLGHSDISTTQIYAKIIDKKLREAADKLPTIDIK